MKRTIIKITSHKTSRAIALVLSFVAVAWFGFAPGSAQGNKARRVVSMKANDSREGAKVTVLADVALNDYEAFRRGDRFSVKLPASEFASAQPNFRGNGFEDVQVQRSGANVLISFKLQPGATARVDQRGNRLDVVFTTTAKQTDNQSNAPGASQNVGSGSGQNRDRRTENSAGPLPPNSPGSVRNASDQNTSEQTRGQSSGQASASSEPDPRKKPESSSSNAPSSQPNGSQSGSIAGVIDSSGTPYPFATPAPSIGAASESTYQSQNQNSAGNTQSVPSESPGSSKNSERWRLAQQWWRLNWQLGTVFIVLLLAGLLFLAFLLFKRFRARRTANQWQPVKRWQGEKVGPSSKPVVTGPVARSAGEILDELVKTNPAVPPSVNVRETVKPEVVETISPLASTAKVAETATEQQEDFELPFNEPTISQLPDVKESPVEPPFSNPPAHFERADFEVKKLLSGKEFDVNLIDAADLPTRQIVGASLIAALASRNFEQHHHARKAFVDYGYFDETTRDLRTVDSPAERSAAARKLGVVGDSRGTAHLVAALFDSAPEVRRSAVESLGQIGDASAIQPLNDLLQRETSRQLPEAVIRHAINSIAVTEVKRSSPVEKSSLRVVEAYRQESNEEFTKLIDELERDESQAQGFAFTSSPATPAVAPPTAPVVPPAPQGLMSSEEVKLQLEEDSLRKAAADLDRRRMEAEAVRQRAEEDARLNAGSEAQARAEIEARMRAEEEARKLVEQEALLRQIEEEGRIKAEHEAKLKAEQEARLRAEAEAQFRQEADTLRRAAEELARKRVEADTARRLAEEHTRKQLEAEALQRAEEEARRLAEEAKRHAEDQMRREVELEMQRRVEEQARQLAAAEVRKRLEDEARKQVEAEARKRAEDEARRRADEETAGRAGTQAHRLFEGDVRIVEQDPLRLPPTNTFLLEAEERRRIEEEHLQEEHQALLRAADDVARRRREVEQSRIKAEEEARFLVAAQERISIEEENRRQVTEERQRLEIEARRRAEEERQRFEEARQRTIEDQKRREDEARRKAEEESKLLAEAQERIRAEEEVRHLAELQRQRLEQEARIRAEQERRRLEEAQQRAMLEQQQLVEAARLNAEQESRLVAAAQQRIQVEEEARKQAEAQRQRLEEETLALEEARRRSEETLRRTAEEQRRVEEEARRLTEEEELRLAELEGIKKRAEDQSRQRAEVEQRIRAEIAALHKAEEEQRIRIESETKRRSEAEASLRDEKARRQAEENARIQAEREAFLAGEARLKTDEESRRRSEDEARVNAEREVRQRAEEEARRREEDAERQRMELEHRLRLEEEAQRQAEEEYRLRSEEEARVREEDERFRKIQDEAQRQAEEIDRVQSQRAQLLADERAFGLESQEVIVDNSTDSAPEQVWGEVAIPSSTREVAAPVVQKQPEVSAAVQANDKGIDVVRAEKGIAPVGEDSDIPAELLHRLNSNSTGERAGALSDIARLGGEDSFRFISKGFDDPSPDVRNAAARALYNLQPDRAASFTRALREGTPDRRRNIGASLASSGLASDAIANLTGESREKTYDAFSLLFLMAKAGEVQPLMKAIEDYPNIEVRLAVVKLLALSGQPEIVPAFRRLAVRGSLPSEVRSAVMEAIYQISSQNRETAPSAA